MKKILLIAAMAVMTLVSCEKDGGDPNTVKHGGVTYKTVTLLNGQTWMAEPLRYVPEGLTPSSDPTSGAHIYNPYKVVDKVAVPLTDSASIAKNGYLYDWVAVFGEEYTEENFNTFEGKQGICPKGWHIPTRAELLDFCGMVQKTGDEEANLVNPAAAIYDASYEGGKVSSANNLGWAYTPSGAIAANKYNTLVIDETNSTLTDLYGQNKMTYIMCSTGHNKTLAFGMMSTFLSKYPEGRLHGSYCFATNAIQVRCIKDAK